ncbi:hypothetical protein [Streptomyces sp. A1499]|nr:hypothetical protein [Streptomyces sp. A1499]
MTTLLASTRVPAVLIAVTVGPITGAASIFPAMLGRPFGDA